jgi:hypothetical protein
MRHLIIVIVHLITTILHVVRPGRRAGRRGRIHSYQTSSIDSQLIGSCCSFNGRAFPPTFDNRVFVLVDDDSFRRPQIFYVDVL